MTTPTRSTTAGRAYLDLRRKARQDHRPVDELMQLYVLECFLARLGGSRFADRFVLKGGVLLAAFGERRPTRDIDFQAQAIDNDPAAILAATTEIAAIVLDDGVAFDIGTATARPIREEDLYQGARVSMTAQLSSARPALHVDISAGDPIVPAPRIVQLPRVLGGELTMRGYPLSMVYAEKIVTAITRGTTSTRWRDFAVAVRYRPEGAGRCGGRPQDKSARRRLVLDGIPDQIMCGSAWMSARRTTSLRFSTTPGSGSSAAGWPTTRRRWRRFLTGPASTGPSAW